MKCHKPAASSSFATAFAARIANKFTSRKVSSAIGPNYAAMDHLDIADRAAPPNANSPVFSTSVVRTAYTAVSATPLTTRIIRTVAIAMLTTFGASGAYAADWYVDGKYGNDANSGGKYSAFKTVQRAWNRASAGDRVMLKPTVTYGPIWLGGKSGYSGKYITLRGTGTGSGMTRVSGKGYNHGITLEKGRSYIRIENLNVTAPGNNGKWSLSAILIPGNHHVQVLNNATHSSGCSGIASTYSDYITIRGNRVWNNSRDHTGKVFCSGISNYSNIDVDGSTGTKMVISHNAVWNNTNTKYAHCSWPCTNSDGNGIIIDDTRRTQRDYKAYRGHTRIENNVSVYNGGRGIHVYSSDNVTITGNTTYMNNRDPKVGSWRPGEVTVLRSGNVKVYHNVLFTDAGYANQWSGNRVSISVQQASKNGSITVDHNLFYNSKNSASYQSFKQNNSIPVYINGNNRFSNPKFKNPGSSLSWADFRPAYGSPAFNFYGPSSFIPKDDFLRSGRWSPMTAGAYQKGG